MNKVAILSDSTCDLSKELLEQYNITLKLISHLFVFL